MGGIAGPDAQHSIPICICQPVHTSSAWVVRFGEASATCGCFGDAVYRAVTIERDMHAAGVLARLMVERTDGTFVTILPSEQPAILGA